MINILVAIISVYLFFLILAFVFQAKMVFFPDPHVTQAPEDIGLSYQEVSLSTSDGVLLHGWFVPGPGGKKRPSVLFFHGNAGNISHRLQMLEILHELGLSCLIIDYRGYGQSRGSPTEQGLYKDGKTAWNWLIQEKGLRPEEIICWGCSLGGAVAARLARDKNPGALIIESSFTSLPDLGQKLYPFLPIKFISRFRFTTRKYLKEVSCPVLLIHSREDEIVPFDHGLRLYEAANNPKLFLEISGGHNDGYIISGQRYISGVKDFLKEFRIF